MSKIIVTDEIIADALSSAKSVNQVMAEKYADEIADRTSKNEKYKNLDPIKMAMADAGLDGTSKIKDFSTAGVSQWLLPVFIDTRLHETVASNSMLGYLTNTSTAVDGISVMAGSLDFVNDADNKKNISLARVAEGADLPIAMIKLGESAIRLHKHGRAIETTYEALQYFRVDLFAKTVDAIANDTADQQMGDAINVLVNGDGNNNAANHIETATAGTVTVDDLLDAMIAFQEQAKMPITTIVAGSNMFKQLFKMVYKTDVAPGAELRFSMRTPQFNANSVDIILDKRVPTGGSSKEQAILLNKDMALVKYYANGSNIREIDKNIRNQTQLGTISEISAFAKFDKNATLLLRSK